MKRILCILFLFTILILSVNAIQASDINMTEAYSTDDANIANYVSEVDTNMDTLTNDNNAPLNQSEITSQSNVIYYNGDYRISLKDANSNLTIKNRTVNLVINSISYTAKTDDDGVASFNLKLAPAKYSILAYFGGDDIYEPSNNLTSTLEILSTIRANDLSKYYKASLPYTATFYDSQGKALANKYVTITVNGKSYKPKTNSNGVASLPVNLKPGTYKIISTDPLTGYKLTTSFRILDTIISGNVQKFIGDKKKFTAKFLKSNGKALAKKYIKFKIKGKKYKVKTKSSGYASLSLKKFKKGTYYVVCYNKDGLTKTFKIQIYKNKATTKLTTQTYTFYQNETKQIRAKFTTSIGGASVSGKTIKIKLNGKTYSKKTDSNGMVYLDLPNLNKGLYTVEYKYAGTKYIKSSKASNFITVLDTSVSDFTVKSTKSFGYGAGTEFKVKVTAGGVPLIKKAVTFTINGKKYVKTTDNNGIASLPITQKIGDYTIYYNTSPDLKVNGSSGSCDINVFKRDNSRLTWKSGSTFKDSLQTFKVHLTDKNGKAISGETVSLKIDGETYTGKTSSNGYATIKTSVAIGKYKVSVKFNGNNFFMESSASKSVNVKLSMFKNGINQKNAVSYLSVYLKSSSHCKVGAKNVKALVKKLTKGMTSKVDKAKAIFNYVRDTLAYSYYYNSKYGSSTTLKLKKGNCVDHSHLLVAMYRTAGFKARYVHGTCTFSDERTGHVWTQVLIDNTWVCGDAISYRNSLGKIKNWNTKTVHIKGKYASLPF